MSRDVSVREKNEALQRVLSSPRFAENASLRHFLEFAGQWAIAGEAEQLKEYVVATRVFHKPQDFDPRLDPVVRVHARRLREKLEEYYSNSGAADPVRIVIPKGTYLPQFVRPSSRWRKPAALWPGVSAVLVVVIALQAWLYFRSSSAGDEPEDRPVAPAFLLKPLLNGPHRTIIAFSNDLFLKDNDGNMFRLKGDQKLDLRNRVHTDLRDLLASPELRGPGPLYLDSDYTGTGEAVCIFLLARYFAERSRPLEVRSSGSLNPQDVSSNNVIFLGSPRENVILDKMAISLDFRFLRRMNPAGRPFLAIENTQPAPGEKALYEARLNPASRNPEEVHALVSFLPGLTAGTHFLILAGQSTAGTQSACEYLLRPEVASELREAWGNGGRAPSSYQILLKATVRDFVPIRTEYVTHHDLNPRP